MNESAEEKYWRLQREIQGAILRNYPNPSRKGCPGEETVRELAANPDSIKAEDEADEQGDWYHITHCSPCYTSFLESRDATRANWKERISDTPRSRRWLDWFGLKRKALVHRKG
jgi:hypothetical protein